MAASLCTDHPTCKPSALSGTSFTGRVYGFEKNGKEKRRKREKKREKGREGGEKERVRGYSEILCLSYCSVHTSNFATSFDFGESIMDDQGTKPTQTDTNKVVSWNCIL